MFKMQVENPAEPVCLVCRDPPRRYDNVARKNWRYAERHAGEMVAHPRACLNPSLAAHLAVIIRAYVGDAHEAIIEFGPAPVPFLGCNAYP